MGVLMGIILAPMIAAAILLPRSRIPRRFRIHGLMLCSFILILFMLSVLQIMVGVAIANVTAGLETVESDDMGFIYDTQYRLTQGWHGEEYSLPGFDYSAGCGAPILSPINGVVARNYVDPLANTVLCIENDALSIVMLHGLYSLPIGTEVQVGQRIGSEASRGRSSGCHTHLSVYDKIVGEWVFPTNLIRMSGVLRSARQNPDWTYRVVWTTEYNPALGGINCDQDCSVTASGRPVEYGITAACGPSIQMGTRVVVEGVGERVCYDRGGAITDKNVDIAVTEWNGWTGYREALFKTY